MQETETIEYKKSLAELSEGLISIAAILNKHGSGIIWFGIRNNGSAVGMEVSDTTLRKVSQAIASHIEPKIYPEVTKVNIKDKQCIRVNFSGSQSPYFAYGRAYMRVADEDRQLSAKELEAIILQKSRNHSKWDSEFITDPLFKPDTSKVRAFVRKAGLKWSNTANVLQTLGLLTGNQYLNATCVFFAKKTPYTLRCAVFAGLTSSTIIDQHDFFGDILTLIEEAEKYVLKNIHIGMRLEGLERVDVPEISHEALREAIINAFCHRDYRDPEEVRIAVFKNRVEIRNPGGLPQGFTLKSLKAGNVSRRRNPTIAELLRRIHLVEAWGRGIPLILENAPNVRFRQTAGIFITEFPRPVAYPESASSLQSVVEEHISGPESGPESIRVRTLLALKRHSLSKAEIARDIGHKSISGRLNQHIRQMLAEDLIQMTIPQKPHSRLQKYRLTAKGNSAIRGIK